jgi:hypothetical protein
MRFNPKLNIVIDSLISKAIETGVDIDVEPAFNDGRGYNSCIIHNQDTNTFGLISTNVKEYPDDSVVYFSFNDKLYAYAKMEGFDTTEEIMDGFDNQVFIKETYKDFVKYLLD